ncbi:unnamed protein product [Didymodactylos carnosus]|uniref:Cyclin-like domain-containing protein n=1 Tax=Didymodactylos carnosus TaxID=1234261 RepID=A0A813U0V9_9BILA|nr:unnamed protein product [Didymodactylos carnosus]CAF0835673.1 unnamed protein product [Didymodactylos carnosus]CAF3606447.1 unnamed protein product [Didymodactylos carnosus]CAF3620447.1 unnamed protein product [Didymodactylos carnosus]
MVVIIGLRTQPWNNLTRTLEYLCSKEERTWKSRKFNQMRLDEVSCTQRNHVVFWLRKVAVSMNFGADTFALSVDLLDRFLATLKVRPKFLECVAVGCLYIAAKIKEEDDMIPITPEFVIDCNSSCSANELLRMERLILEKFEWYADYVTCVDFMQIYFALLLQVVWEENFTNEHMIEKYKELEIKLSSCLQYHRLASFKPRVLALALISIELEQQQQQTNIDWLACISYLQRLAKVESESLLQCRELVVRVLVYKVVRLESSDLAFISRAAAVINDYNLLNTLLMKSNVVSGGDNICDRRPTYADVVSGRVQTSTSPIISCATQLQNEDQKIITTQSCTVQTNLYIKTH